MKTSELIKYLTDILSECGNINIYVDSGDKWNSIYTDWIQVGDKYCKHEMVWK